VDVGVGGREAVSDTLGEAVVDLDDVGAGDLVTVAGSEGVIPGVGVGGSVTEWVAVGGGVKDLGEVAVCVGVGGCVKVGVLGGVRVGSSVGDRVASVLLDSDGVDVANNDKLSVDGKVAVGVPAREWLIVEVGGMDSDFVGPLV
jgi:hypothetical protein